MDFDLGTENIPPLICGGRNISQLEVELMQQKEAFENAIGTYEGDDPLQNWFDFITWVEQSYPEHGLEGNLINLLEDCLSKFEDDVRYVHDRRFCKLWIKYIDLQPNPSELFQMLYARGICRSCSDLYKAWAHYHEVAGDYKTADDVFQLGMSELAQPYEELAIAKRNLTYAVGLQATRGSTANSQRLEEQRKALTMLQSGRSTEANGRAVHGDMVDLHAVGIMLPKEYFPVTHEDYSNWCPPLAHFEPDDPSKIPMYPKSIVYGWRTELSIEEIKAEKYKLKMSSEKPIDVCDLFEIWSPLHSKLSWDLL